MQIFVVVRFLESSPFDTIRRTITLDNIRGDETIEDIKNLLETKTEVPSNQIRLIFQGKQLEDHRILSDYTIIKESTIEWVPRLRGD